MSLLHKIKVMETKFYEYYNKENLVVMETKQYQQLCN